MTFGFLSGSRNFCKLLWVSCEVLFLHGYGWILWMEKSCNTTAYRWLFRNSQLSLKTLWSAVIKSPKFAAWGTVPPLRLLHGALVILVRLQISQFRSLGKWVWTLCLPKSSRLFVIGSKETSWEELAWEPPCYGISSSTKFSLNSCSHSPFHRGFLFLVWISLAWISSGFPDLSSTNSDTGTGEVSLLVASSRSRTGISLTVGEEGEDEEDDEEWLSCFIGVLEVDEDAEEELVKPGTTIGTKFSVLEIFRIPSLRRCGFWPLIHSLEYPFSSSRIYPILWHTQLPLHAFALLHWRLWLS